MKPLKIPILRLYDYTGWITISDIDEEDVIPIMMQLLGEYFEKGENWKKHSFRSKQTSGCSNSSNRQIKRRRLRL